MREWDGQGFRGSPLIFQESIAIRLSCREQVLDWTSSLKKKCKNPLGVTKYTKTTRGLKSLQTENNERTGACRGGVFSSLVLFTFRKVYGCFWRQDVCVDELTWQDSCLSRDIKQDTFMAKPCSTQATSDPSEAKAEGQLFGKPCSNSSLF